MKIVLFKIGFFRTSHELSKNNGIIFFAIFSKFYPEFNYRIGNAKAFQIFRASAVKTKRPGTTQVIDRSKKVVFELWRCRRVTIIV
jgi:hypothetical protein